MLDLAAIVVVMLVMIAAAFGALLRVKRTVHALERRWRGWKTRGDARTQGKRAAASTCAGLVVGGVVLDGLVVIGALAVAGVSIPLAVLGVGEALFLAVAFLVVPIRSAELRPIVAGFGSGLASDTGATPRGTARTVGFAGWVCRRASRNKHFQTGVWGPSRNSGIIIGVIFVYVIAVAVFAIVFIPTAISLPEQLAAPHAFDWVKAEHLRAPAVAAATALALVFALDGLAELRSRVLTGVGMAAQVLFSFALVGVAPPAGDWLVKHHPSGLPFVGRSTILGMAFGVFTAAFIEIGHALLAVGCGFLTPVAVERKVAPDVASGYRARELFGYLHGAKRTPSESRHERSTEAPTRTIA